MALLRMTVAALVACSSAAADPGAPAGVPPGALPAGWTQLPPIAAAVAAAAKADGVVIDAAESFGEPARGCYAIRLALHGPAGAPAQADQVADQVLAGFLAPHAAAGTPAGAAGTPAGAAGTHAGAAGIPAGAAGIPAGAAGPPARAPGSQGAAAEPPGAIAISDVVKPTGTEGVLGFTFARPPYQGRVRAQVGHGRIAAIACFANQREPLACDAACARVLQDLPPGAPEGAR